MLQSAAISPSLEPFISGALVASVPRSVSERATLVRLPQSTALIAFAIEDGASLPGGRPLGGGWHAALLLVPAHLCLLSIPRTVRYLVALAMKPLALRIPWATETTLAATRCLGLSEFWGRNAEELLERLLAQAPTEHTQLLQEGVAQHLCEIKGPCRVALEAAQAIEHTSGSISLEALARLCRCSDRTVRDALISRTGLGPKQLARIARMRRSVSLLTAGMDLKSAAADSGFADQSHMTREFRALLGESPGWFTRRFPGALTSRPLDTPSPLGASAFRWRLHAIAESG